MYWTGNGDSCSACCSVLLGRAENEFVNASLGDKRLTRRLEHRSSFLVAAQGKCLGVRLLSHGVWTGKLSPKNIPAACARCGECRDRRCLMRRQRPQRRDCLYATEWTGTDHETVSRRITASAGYRSVAPAAAKTSIKRYDVAVSMVPPSAPMLSRSDTLTYY